MKKTVALLFFLSLPGVVHADWTQDTMRWQQQQQQIQDRQQDRVNDFFFGSKNTSARQDSDQKLRDKAQDEEIRELRRQLEQQKAEQERQTLEMLTDYIRTQQAKAGSTPPTADFAGTWRGAYKSSSAGDRTMTMSLSQKGTSVSGKASTSGGGQLSIYGSVVGDALAYIANVTVPGCTGTFVGSGLVSGETMVFGYNGAASAACGGEESGEGSLTKE